MQRSATLSRSFHAPGDWIAAHSTARQRRSLIAWVLIIDILSTPIQYPFRTYVSLVWFLSQIALIIGLGGMLSAETPVEKED